MNTPLYLVIPCFDPPDGWTERISSGVERLRAALPERSLQVILVNDGSRRNVGTTEREHLARDLGEMRWVEHDHNRGKGAALRTGVAACGEGPVLFTDVDLPYTVESMVKAARALMAGSDAVLGHRSLNYYQQVPRIRRSLSRGFRWVLRHVLRFEITDTQCGLKGFNARGRAIFLSTTIDRFLFDMEFILLLSRRKELLISTIEAELASGVRFTHLNYRILGRESVNFLKVLLRDLSGR